MFLSKATYNLHDLQMFWVLGAKRGGINIFSSKVWSCWLFTLCGKGADNDVTDRRLFPRIKKSSPGIRNLFWRIKNVCKNVQLVMFAISQLWNILILHIGLFSSSQIREHTNYFQSLTLKQPIHDGSLWLENWSLMDLDGSAFYVNLFMCLTLTYSICGLSCLGMTHLSQH